MQVVRNIYLSHEKNLSRKVEEIILSYMLEEIFTIKKERIFEIYLNIIELGPLVYGISEACSFYFSKNQSEITLTESLVISYIIPRPKFFLDAVKEKSIILINNLRNHIQIFSKEMLKQGMISNSEYNSISYKIVFCKDIGTIELK